MKNSICDFSILRELRKREKMSIAELSSRSGIAASVISKLERNCNMADMNTLYKIARIFGLTLSDLISLAENRLSHAVEAEHYCSGDFHFDRVSYSNVRCMHAVVKCGDKVSTPSVHRDDYELCRVTRGKIRITLPDESCELNSERSLQFDALLPHTYEALSDAEIFIVHVRKEKRF